jgi:hypothetical protein
MILRFLRTILAVGLVATSAACTSELAADRLAVGSNRSFANARNEILLLNILRAWANEPLQFSTVSSATGTARSGAELTLPFANILGGDPAAEFGPSLKITARNPTITITALDSQSFLQGVNRPLDASAIDSLIAQGWHRPTILGLAIGGVQCGQDGADPRLNLTPNDPSAHGFDWAFNNSGGFQITDDRPRVLSRVRLPVVDALKLLREGAGPGRLVRIAEPEQPQPDKATLLVPPPPAPPPPTVTTDLELEVVTEASTGILGLNFSRVCELNTFATQHKRWPLITRSAEGMIRYLAEVFRRDFAASVENCAGGSPQASLPEEAPNAVDPAPDPASAPPKPGGGDNAIQPVASPSSERPVPLSFHLRWTCPGAPPPETAAISTFFRGRYFYVRRSTANDPDDRTLQIFSILTDLIAQHITEQSIAASRPLIAIGQ